MRRSDDWVTRRYIAGLGFCFGIWALTVGCSPPSGTNQVDTKPSAEADQQATPSATVVEDVKVSVIADDSPRDDGGERTATATALQFELGNQLYARHCAACHGDKGDGLGAAARFLYPKPRDFRAGRFRLVSTSNFVPTLEDVEEVLVRGMPGSAMVSWAHLPVEERRALAAQVMHFRRQGARDIELQVAADEEIELTEEEIAENIAPVTVPDDVLSPPEIGDPSAEAIARGKELYVAKGCVSCHGPTGKGDGQQQMVDNEGVPTKPRDLTRGIYKGNHDPASIYRRLWLGMPGSPMPASQQLTPEQVTDMVHFLLSLSDEATRQAAVMRRAALTAERVERLPTGPTDGEWGVIASQRVATTPLWWRDESDRDLQVHAVHDGKSLAIRASWSDTTQNDAAIRPDEFEDLAAVQLHVGAAEPFLGMGAHGAAVDVWQWRGGGHQDGADRWQSDEYPFDTAIYRELFPGKTLPDFVTARAGGNPLATRAHSAGNLAAVGFGSLTYRASDAQLVEATGTWSDGRWQVQWTRPLDPGDDRGTPLRAGEKASVAFAIWDGAARDRAGQKLVSLWNDLILK